MKNTLNYIKLSCFALILSSCSSAFIKDGYFLKTNTASYYGNDKENIYINFSDKFTYNEIGFNANNLSTNDVDLAKEFKIKPEKLLFSYHSSSGRQAMAFLLNKNQVNFVDFVSKKIENTEYYYKTSENERYVYRQNIYPFKNKFVKVIEKSPIYLSKNSSKEGNEKTKIFPEITTIKPTKK